MHVHSPPHLSKSWWCTHCIHWELEDFTFQKKCALERAFLTQRIKALSPGRAQRKTADSYQNTSPHPVHWGQQFRHRACVIGAIFPTWLTFLAWNQSFPSPRCLPLLSSSPAWQREGTCSSSCSSSEPEPEPGTEPRPSESQSPPSPAAALRFPLEHRSTTTFRGSPSFPPV